MYGCHDVFSKKLNFKRDLLAIIILAIGNHFFLEAVVANKLSRDSVSLSFLFFFLLSTVRPWVFYLNFIILFLLMSCSSKIIWHITLFSDYYCNTCNLISIWIYWIFASRVTLVVRNQACSTVWKKVLLELWVLECLRPHACFLSTN